MLCKSTGCSRNVGVHLSIERLNNSFPGHGEYESVAVAEFGVSSNLLCTSGLIVPSIENETEVIELQAGVLVRYHGGFRAKQTTCCVDCPWYRHICRKSRPNHTRARRITSSCPSMKTDVGGGAVWLIIYD